MLKATIARNVLANTARIVTVLFGLFAFMLSGRAADSQSTRPAVAEQLRGEIVALASDLRTLHPQPFAHVSESAFDALEDRLISEVGDDWSQREMLWAFSELLASIGCGHSTLPFFNQEDMLIPASARLPVDVTLVDGRLFVVDPLANDSVLGKGDEITTINGIPVRTLIDTALRHIPSDGHNPHSKAGQFRVYATSYLTYALGFPPSYTVTVEGSDAPLKLAPLATFQHRPIISPSALCQNTLCLDQLDNDVVLMTIRSWDFYGDRLAIFKAFIDESFASFSKDAPRMLIIDVRKNLGGTGYAAAYLLRHLADTEFSYFHPNSTGSATLKQPLAPIETGWSGAVTILSDEFTHSATGHFLSLVKEHNLGLIVGRPSGAGSEVNDGAKRFVSEHSKIEYKVARNTFLTNTPSHSASVSIAPDVAVPLTLETLIDDRDAILETALSDNFDDESRAQF